MTDRFPKVLILALLLLLISNNSAFANKINNVGTDFWFSMPPGLEDLSDDNNNVYIFVTSEYNTKVNLRVPGKNVKRELTLKSGETSSFSLTPIQAQVYIKSGQDPVVESNVVGNSGINISSEAPVSVVVILQYGNQSEGFTPLPVSSTGTKYQVASFGDGSLLYPFYDSFPSLTTITAAFDNTIVDFTLPTGSDAQIAGNFEAGITERRILDKGAVWVISTRANGSDLSGSTIETNYPVSVVSGNQSANVPIMNKWNNYIVESEIPINARGYNYHIPNIKNRKYSPVIRVYSENPNTEVFADGNTIGNIGDKLFLEYRFNDNIGSSIGTISSDDPIQVVLYNSGIEEEGSNSVKGTPFQMNLIPLEQYTNDISFAIPSGSSNFNENYIVLIHEQDISANNFEFRNNEQDWDSIDKLFIEETLVFDSDFNEKQFQMSRILLPDADRFEIRSKNKFIAYLYGYNGKMSYGVPSETIVTDLESNDSEAPIPTWIQLCNGNVEGIVTDYPQDESRSNLTIPIIHTEFTKNYRRNFDEIIPGITETANWKLEVINPKNEAQIRITFRDKAGNDTTISIYYHPINLYFEPEKCVFGNVAIKEEFGKAVSLKNESSEKVRIIELFVANEDSPFSISDIETPFEMQDNSALSILIELNAQKPGLYTDTLVALNDCGIRTTCLIEAIIDAPEIEVTNITFGKHVINSTITKTAEITNLSSVDLIITGFEGPNHDVYKILELDISSNNPLILSGGEKKEFKVEFTPNANIDYNDEIRFISNAVANESFDNVCEIYASGIEPGLTANSINWNRKRINRQQFPAGPYEPDNNIGIVITNRGQQQVTINDIEIENNVAFGFNDDFIKGAVLDHLDSIVVNVTFNPEQTGNYRTIINYIDNQLGKASTILEGIGVAPKVNDYHADLDTSIIGSENSPNKSYLRIYNLNYNEWQFADTLNIFDIRASKSGEISFDNNFSELGFRINKSEINLPLSLAPGQFIDIPIDFSAVNAGEVFAQLRIISDALNEADFTLRAYGIDQEIEITNGYGETCIGESINIDAFIKNNGSVPLSIEEVNFENNVSEYDLAEPDISTGFSINPNESKAISMVYRPTTESYNVASLIMIDKENSNEYKVEFVGRTIQIQRELSLSPVSKSIDVNKTSRSELIIEDGENIEQYEINDFKISIEYDGQVLQPILESINIADNYAGLFRISNTKMIDANSLELSISSIAGESLFGHGKLISWDYETYLPQSMARGTLLKANLETYDTECVKFKSTTADIKLLPVCADSLRRVNISNSNFEFNSIDYKQSNLKIDYSTGLSSTTKIEIYDILGNIVAVPLNEHTEPGNYVLDKYIDIPQGVYFCRIISGPFVLQKKFITLN